MFSYSAEGSRTAPRELHQARRAASIFQAFPSLSQFEDTALVPRHFLMTTAPSAAVATLLLIYPLKREACKIQI